MEDVEMYYKDLVPMMMETQRVTVCCLSAGGPGEPAVQFQPKPEAQEWEGDWHRVGAGVSLRLSLKSDN